MSFKTGTVPDEFLRVYRKYDSLDYSKFDVAYKCWDDLRDENKRLLTQIEQAKKRK